MRYYLAVDIGASSGRHVLGYKQDGRLVFEEIHRFRNNLLRQNGMCCWDFNALFAEVLAGMRKCGEMGRVPVSVGVDTWGVDFVLLDGTGQVLGCPVSYRDTRTNGMDALVARRMSEEELYRRTGIQKQIFNTIYQLMAVKNSREEHLQKARCLLLLPDYFHFLLCGARKTEYTNATTTQLVNATRRQWDDELIAACGYPRDIFQEIVPPGTELGTLTPAVRTAVGYGCAVVAPVTHDTGSAVLAVPASGQDVLYISSGTWSLMGTERAAPDCSPQSRAHNFTNEGGYGGTYRFLKNIMGLWMLQCVGRELGGAYSFDALSEMAARETITSLVDCNDNRFLSPENMSGEIARCCAESGQAVPQTPGALAAVIYNSLAVCYGQTAQALETLTGRTFRDIHIIGGGAKDAYLNALTARRTGKTVLAGPTEATAVGNLLAQMITGGEFGGVAEARQCVSLSADLKVCRPPNSQ
ncbi:MAG: rhamnulokinase [Oscillospiraceae bacterium]|jgi:rhamnulokinase|nr:rhamnulokinase [Oscillospiraceae bacterium]